jgi:flagellin FlaB
MVGIEAAMVLIAFVIVAAAFSFMVVNMGLFSTQRGRETIQQGVSEASSPLTLDGSIHVNVVVDTGGVNVTGIVVPLKTLGVRYVPMSSNESEVTCRVENETMFGDMYNGIDDSAGKGPQLEDLFALIVDTVQNRAELFIGNSDLDSSLDIGEKGFFVVYFGSADQASVGDFIFLEVRPERGAPLSVEFIVPSELIVGWSTIGA